MVDAAIDEISLGRSTAATCARIPLNQVTGFRPPYLEAARWTYDALKTLGFTYFSSNPDSYGDSNNFPGRRVRFP
jgi:hypothetical protein